MPETSNIRPERLEDAAAIEALQQSAFGPGAYARAAFRVREQAEHDRQLSFVAERSGALIGSVRMTPVSIGDHGGLLLGPLVVDPCCKKMGYGRTLMRTAVEAARQGGHAYIMLVGDQPYYWPFGFRPVRGKSIAMPGPVDPLRLLAVELRPGALTGAKGTVCGVRNRPAVSAARPAQAARI